MGYDTKVRVGRDLTLTLKDNGANTIELKFDGSISWGEAVPAQVIKDRGALDHWRPGDEEPIPVHAEFLLTEYTSETGGTDVSPLDAILQRNNAASWATVSGTDVYALNGELGITNPASGGATETVTFSQMANWRFEVSEEDEGLRVSLDCECLAVTSVKA